MEMTFPNKHTSLKYFHVYINVLASMLIYILYMCMCIYMAFSGGMSGKVSACQCRRHKRRGFNPRVEKIPRRRAWQPITVFLPGESHGQRSLVDYSS